MNHFIWSPLRLSILVVTMAVTVLIVFGLTQLGLHLPAVVLMLVGLIAVIFQVVMFIGIAAQLQDFMRRLGGVKAFEQTIPLFRFVDYYRAILGVSESAQATRIYPIQITTYGATLTTMLNSASFFSSQQAEQKRREVGFDQFAFFPTDILCLVVGCEGFDKKLRFVLRLSPRQHNLALEVAAWDNEMGERMMRLLHDLAAQKSIYRNQFVEIRPAERVYQVPGANDELDVVFKERPHITASDIILDDRIHAVLRRTFFDFHEHRVRLRELGLPRKRTLLIYGPPGTGKTHTCRYVHTVLDNITTFQVGSSAMSQINRVSQFARELHPALIVLEDIDLVFNQREINVYATVLGELMEQLDGFAEDEEIFFILTTNAIERVEQAIKDRPGRVNQCLYFGLPGPELRRLFLARLLSEYGAGEVDVEHLVRQTERTSQAFLKEYVQRAVQIAAEESGYSAVAVQLKTKHFDQSFEELTSHGDPHGHAIMGFHPTL